MERLLACKCKEDGCHHWEVVLEDFHDEVHVDGAEGATLRCKTCTTEIPIDVEAHQDLIIVERP